MSHTCQRLPTHRRGNRMDPTVLQPIKLIFTFLVPTKLSMYSGVMHCGEEQPAPWDPVPHRPGSQPFFHHEVWARRLLSASQQPRAMMDVLCHRAHWAPPPCCHDQDPVHT